MKTYYDMLSVAPDAAADDIKKAFRREIARYHPDKVQHLGAEFQEMASGIAADLTEAYRILMDPALRAKYDEDIRGGASRASTPTAPPPPAAPEDPPPPRRDPTATAASSAVPPAQSQARPTAGLDFVKRAAMSKIREAIDDVLSGAAAVSAPGFDIAVVTKPKKGLFKKAEPSVCLLVKFVPHVDPESVAAVWPAGVRVRAGDAVGCVLMLVGPAVAPAKELAAAVTEQRRKTRGTGPVLVPVDVRDWEALFPPETPATVRAVIQRLKDDKR